MDEESEKKARAAKIKAGIAFAKKLYALGSYYGPRIAQIAIFDHRGSDERTYFDSFEAHLLKTQKDFPALPNDKILHFFSGQNRLAAYLYEADAPKRCSSSPMALLRSPMGAGRSPRLFPSSRL
jgi:hypothetical protein